ncbi:NB-ARC domain-containing protein [Corchorus olitorius]|uniref:NB-ARC domain-containing protein n=1 Tax=Corchorus olitorius TaxID=93759 RepID=A0A1R3I572_9ROSI|nr:NB-ARC domain-containing protein [Corchorus olitorius]
MIAFPESDSIDKTIRVDSCMEELGKGMIKHCAGLPLAIVVLGGILASKCSVIEWQKVSKNVKTYLKGERYMIQGEERDVIGKTKTCRMHDVIRDACLSKAKQENFFHIIDYSSPLTMVRSGLQKMDPIQLMQFFLNCVNIYELSLSWVEMSKLPQHHHFPSDMAYVSLEGSKLHEDPMTTLEKLPNLRILILGKEALTGKKMVCSAQGFPKLDSLSLDKLYNLDFGGMGGG